jgi:hypothetical protein
MPTLVRALPCLALAVTACDLGIAYPQSPLGTLVEVHDETTWIRVGTPSTAREAGAACHDLGGALAVLDDAGERDLADDLAELRWTWIAGARAVTPTGILDVDADAAHAFLCEVRDPAGSAKVMYAADWSLERIGTSLRDDFHLDAQQASVALAAAGIDHARGLHTLLDLYPLGLEQVLALLRDVYGMDLLEAATEAWGMRSERFPVTELSLLEGVRAVFGASHTELMIVQRDVFDAIVEVAASTLFHDFGATCDEVEAVVQQPDTYALDAERTHDLRMSDFVACTPRDVLIAEGDDILARYLPAIRRYAPVVALDAGERYFAEPIEMFLDAMDIAVCPSGRCGTRADNVEHRVDPGESCPLDASDAGALCTYTIVGDSPAALKRAVTATLAHVYEDYPQLGACVDAWTEEDRGRCHDQPFDDFVWYQSVSDADHARMSAGAPGAATTYVHINRFAEEGVTDLQFWLFYGFNGPGTIRTRPQLTWSEIELDELGIHDADWEVVHIRIDDATLELVDEGTLFLSGHGHHTRFDRDEIHFARGTQQPMVFPSRNGHANQIDPGDHPEDLFCVEIGVDMEIDVTCDCSSDCPSRCDWDPTPICDALCDKACDIAGKVCDGLSAFDVGFDTQVAGESLNITRDPAVVQSMHDSFEVVAIDGIVLDDDMGLHQEGAPILGTWFAFPGGYAPTYPAELTFDDVAHILELDELFNSGMVDDCVAHTGWLDELPGVNRGVRRGACRAVLDPIDLVGNALFDKVGLMDDITRGIMGSDVAGRPSGPVAKRNVFLAGPHRDSFTESGDPLAYPSCLDGVLRVD